MPKSNAQSYLEMKPAALRKALGELEVGKIEDVRHAISAKRDELRASALVAKEVFDAKVHLAQAAAKVADLSPGQRDAVAAILAVKVPAAATEPGG